MIFQAFGIPKGQPRVRAFVRGRHAGVYDPGTADDWKAAIHIAAKEELRVLGTTDFPLYKGAVCVDCTFIFPRPKSHFRSNGQLKPGSPLWHTSKPDRDNLDKAVLDTLTKLQLWPDDSYVASGSLTKRYAEDGEQTGAVIEITPLLEQ